MLSVAKLAARGIGYAKRIHRAGTDWGRIRGYADRAQLQWRFRRAVRGSKPLVLAQDGDVQVHLLFSHRTTHEAIATIQSLYRFTPAWPVVLHEDGSITDADRSLLVSLLPGARIIDRSVADREVIAAAEQAGLTRLAQLRRTFVLALKLLDVPFYAAGVRTLLIDTDVLFHREPTELLTALQTPDNAWRDWYSEDFRSSYAWDLETIRDHTGVEILPRVNTGLVALRRPTLEWERYEPWLGVPVPVTSPQHVEQTLFALEFTVNGARVLAPEYDVMFRASYSGNYSAWLESAPGGEAVVAQHYCGGERQRRYYYRHYLQQVAPSYQAR